MTFETETESVADTVEPSIGDPIVGENDEAQFTYKNYTSEQWQQRERIRKAALRKFDWPVKDKFVVSGMSGRFPESNSIQAFSDNLYANRDMIVEDERRWPFGYLGLPKGSGKIHDLELFDYRFFQVPEEDANFMDAQVRIALEICFEALWDAGLDPETLAGTRTGVFLGNCFDEFLSAYAQDYTRVPAFRQCFYAALANVYDFRGPSKPFDTACASGFSALHEALVSLRSGECDRAIVLGLNVCLRAVTQNQFLKLNMISPDGHCKCLDDDANGYAKGEATVAFLIQPEKEAKRVYVELVHSKTNSDGFKDLGITYPSFELQCELMQDCYTECGLDPAVIDYCEAHCTGTQAGDPSEMRAIVGAMCQNRKTPLKIGAIKSVIGHTEASSGLCSLVKAIFSFENEMIPANLHLQTLNHRIDGLMSGVLQPINENTPFDSDYISLNCFGFGGVNVHLITKRNENKEIHYESREGEKLPRLIAFCGRNLETLQSIENHLRTKPESGTPAFLTLLNDCSKTSPFPVKMYKGMRHRGFLIRDPESGTLSELTSFKVQSKAKPKVCFVFNGMGSQWRAMSGSGLLDFPAIKESLRECYEVLKTFDPEFDLFQLLERDPKTPTECFCTIAAIQMALVDFLADLKVLPDSVFGHSIGELSAAYANGRLTRSNTIKAAYLRGKAIENTEYSGSGAMAAIGCSWTEAEEFCRKFANGKVFPACNNSMDSVTVAGKREDVEKFLGDIENETNGEMFARIVASTGVAFHSSLVGSIQNELSESLKEFVKIENPESIKNQWISTTYSEFQESDFGHQYLIDNLVKPCKFLEAFEMVPKDSLFVEIGATNLLQSLIKRNTQQEKPQYVSSMIKNRENRISILQLLGSLYGHGLNPEIERLYPKIQFPVPRGTAQLNSLINWRHDRKFTVTQYPEFFNHTKLYETAQIVDIRDEQHKYIIDHCIDGRVLFPATGYIFLAWTKIANILKKDFTEFPVEFENVSIHRATIMPKNSQVAFDISFLQNTGKFAITEGGSLVTSGSIRFLENSRNPLQHQSLLEDLKKFDGKDIRSEMASRDIYKEFRLRGYDYGLEFQALQSIKQENESGQIAANVFYKNWVTFVDGLIQLAVLGKPIRGLFLPVRFDYLRCDPRILLKHEGSELEAIYDEKLNIGVAPGIEYQGIKANLAPRKDKQIPIEEVFEFVPNDEKELPVQMNRSIPLNKCEEITQFLVDYEKACQKLLDGKLTEEKRELIIERYEKQFHNQKAAILEAINTGVYDNIEEDQLLCSWMNERFIRSQLEIFVENQVDQTNVPILEITQSRDSMVSLIFKLLTLLSFKISFRYSLLHPEPNKIPSAGHEGIHSSHDWLVEKSRLPPEVTQQKMILYRDSSLSPVTAKVETNLEILMESIWNSLADRGFALFFVRDTLYDFEKNILRQRSEPESSKNTSRVEQLLSAISKYQFQIVSKKNNSLDVHSILIRKMTIISKMESQTFITITGGPQTWFSVLQEKIRQLESNPGDEKDPQNIWLVSNKNNSGLIGFISCLHKEPLGVKVRCIINLDSRKRELDLKDPMVERILAMDLYTNAIDQQGNLGSYRHFTLANDDSNQSNKLVPAKHCYINVETRGDLSSLKWYESQHKFWPLNRKSGQMLVDIFYSALNFRDIMLATGKLPPDALPDNMGMDDCILGFEFAGRDPSGGRVMGIVSSKALATSVVMDSTKFLWPIPDHWSMEDASTVPVAYATAYYALCIRGKLQRGDSILIHSGSGAVGQASISIALDHDCKLFISVGTDDKRQHLLEMFPELKSHQFHNSRDINFEREILQHTNGRGVDLILNSLADEKLQSSVNCLAEGGRFLEIGKYDLSQNTPLNISKIMKNQTFHGILLDNLFNFTPNCPPRVDRDRESIWTYMQDGIKRGVVRPLTRTIFELTQAEEAFRFMATGKHIGKVVIRLRDEKSPGELLIPAIPRTVFQNQKTYIITGGLGGFGLELINWMVEREARKFVVTSRSGVRELYQKSRLRYFESIGVKIEVFTGNTSTEAGCVSLIQQASTLGPIGGVFHLAMVLRDGLFDNLSAEDFEAVVQPKGTTFSHLDVLTRNHCPELDYFVAFSSVSCGVGNPGQSNYGYANSMMERICDQRRADGLHGFAIQWGAIGDVGYIIDNIRGNEIVVCGSIPQRIPSCLASLDRLLQSQFSVCANMIKQDYKFENSGSRTNLFQNVVNILGVKNAENLQPTVTLAELGMDSLMGVEVKQAIERDYELVLSMQEIRKLTVGQIIEIGAGRIQQCSVEMKDKEEGENVDDGRFVAQEPITYLNEITNGSPIVVLPPIDGNLDKLRPIAKKLNRPVLGLNWSKDCSNLETVSDVAVHYIRRLEKIIGNRDWDLIGYSWGGIIAIEIGLLLQTSKGHKDSKDSKDSKHSSTLKSSTLRCFNKIVLLDSSPKQFKMFTEEAARKYDIKDNHGDRAFVESILMFLMSMLPIDYQRIKDQLLQQTLPETRIELVKNLFQEHLSINLTPETLKFLIESHYRKILMINQYEVDEVNSKLNGGLLLIRASKLLVKETSIVRDDYWLSDLVNGSAQIVIVDGDHESFLVDPSIPTTIQAYFQ